LLFFDGVIKLIIVNISNISDKIFYRENSMKITVLGGTGFIGKILMKNLVQEGHKVVLLSRNPLNISKADIEAAKWDADHIDAWIKYIDGADAIINLSGEPIGSKRWTQKQKDKIIDSRLKTTRAIVSAISKSKSKPKLLINASAVGYYGNVESGEVTELSDSGAGFLSDVCKKWETGAKEAEKYGVRVVLVRLGIVLEKDGGALKKMLLPFKLFIGGPLGSGKQWLPWVHRDDLVGSMLFILKNQNISGVVNITSPNPVRMKEFSRELGKILKRPSMFPVPAFVLKILLGEMSEMILTGQKAIPQKLIEAGYKFKFPELKSALKEILI
jgi:uncharacterized protein